MGNIFGVEKPSMVAALIIRQGKLLLVHNAKSVPVRIEPPGGKTKDGEDAETAVRREAKEELGLTVRPYQLLGTYDTETPEGEFSVKMFLCELVAGDPQIREPKKLSRFGWYSYREMEGMFQIGTLAPNLCAALPEIKKLL